MGINQLRLELQNSDKSRIISNLTSVFAHEIRNPLQTTRGFLQLLRQTDSRDKKKEYIQISIDELDRANEIINEFLAFGKPSTNNNERLDAGHQLRRVINIIQTYSSSRNVEIIANIFQDCFIHANPFRLSQILVNIY
jgi:two-component system sporulation sensor kinase B